MGPLVNDLNQSINRSHHTFFIGGNIMKKILSFVLVLAMVLGSVSMVFATDYPDVKDTDDCAEAVNVLSSVGIIEGYNDGTFKPEKTITRAEAIKIVVAALGLPVTEGNSYPTQFTDVPATAWYSGYVRYGVALGITEGTSKDHFSPDSLVTYDQMITFIMRTLGYTDDLVGGYPTGYIMRAFQEGIITAETTTGTAPAPRGDIAEILYASLSKRFVAYDPEKDVFNAEPDKYSVGKANMYALLGCDTSNWDVVDNALIEATKNVDLSKYLGAYVQIVEKDGDIIGVGEVISEFVEGKVSDGKLGDYKIDTATVTMGVTDKNATAHAFEHFKNGYADGAAVAFTNSSKFAVVVENGTVKNVVSQQEWAADDDFRATKANVADMNPEDSDVLPTVNGSSFVVEEKAVVASSYTIEGVKSLSDIAENNIVYVYKYPAGANAGKISKIEVGTEVVEGKLTAISSDQKSYTIGGTKYTAVAGREATIYDNTLIGKDVSAYLDINGKIYEYELFTEADDTTTVYGVIIAGKAGSTGGSFSSDKKPQISVFNADGETKTYEIKEKTTGTPTFTYATDIKAAFLPNTNAAGEDAGKGDLVKLTLNGDGLVTAIAGKDANIAGITAKGVAGSNLINSDTKVILYTGTTTADVYNAKKYEVISYSKVLDQAAATGTAITKSSKVNCALITGGITAAKGDILHVVVTGYSEIADSKISVTTADGKTYTADAANKADYAYAAPTTSAATLYTFKVDTDNVIDETKAPAGDWDKPAGTKIVLTDKSTAASDSVAKLGTTLVECDENTVVYTYTAETKKWSVSKGSSALVGLKAGNAVYIYDTDTTTTAIEAAIVVK